MRLMCLHAQYLSRNGNLDYTKLEITYGLTDTDGSPIRCFCGCTDFEQSNEYYDEHSLVEYTLHCKCCGAKVGVWAYGQWCPY